MAVRYRLAPARHDPILQASATSTFPGVHWLRRGLRNRLAHAEGAAFLVNPAAKTQTPTTTSTLSPLKALASNPLVPVLVDVGSSLQDRYRWRPVSRYS